MRPLIRDGLNSNYRAPKCRAEETLVRIWEKTLGVTPIGIDDDFFELGGESITAIQLLNSIDKKLGVKISLIALFEYPSIRQLTHIVGKSLPNHSRL